MSSIPDTIISDEMRLQQVLSNLCINAVKFTEQGQIWLEVTVDGNMLDFKIIDTGIGISEVNQSKLFAPFTQADVSITRKFGGTGLGLIISKRLANLLGGDITFSSIEGEGSQFTCRIQLEVSQGANWVHILDVNDEINAVIPTKLTQLHGKVLLAERS